MNHKILTMTAYKRPEYTKKVLDNLQQCIGFEEYTLLATIEPGFPEVIELFSSIPNCEIVVNEELLGCGANTFKALKRGFDRTDFVIHLEDDTLPGIDSLRYFEWLCETYKDDKEIFTVTAYNKKDINQIPPNNIFTVYRRRWFSGWFWGLWIDRFEEMSKNWNSHSWDVNINKNLRKNRYELCPYLARSQNIGQYSGTNVRPGYWKKHHYNPVWINNIMNFANVSDISDIFLKFGFENRKNFTYKEVSTPITDQNILDSDQEIFQLMTTGAIIGITYFALKR